MVKVDVFQCFTNETYKLLQSLRKKKIINDEEYINFGECRIYKEVKILIQKNFSITETEIMPTWEYIIDHWDWKRAKKNESTVFNDCQSSFIKELLKRNGIYDRDQCQKETLTDHQISTNVGELEEMDYIVSFRTSKKCGNKTIFAIHPGIMKEIRTAK